MFFSFCYSRAQLDPITLTDSSIIPYVANASQETVLGWLFSIMLVVHAEFTSVQPSELLERPSYVNTGESSSSYIIWQQTMWIIGTSLSEYKEQNYWWKNEKYCFFIQQIFASSSASPCRNHIVEDLNREQKFLLALIILPEVSFVLFFSSRVSVFHYI